jgi:hypothetical protein
VPSAKPEEYVIAKRIPGFGLCGLPGRHAPEVPLSSPAGWCLLGAPPVNGVGGMDGRVVIAANIRSRCGGEGRESEPVGRAGTWTP